MAEKGLSELLEGAMRQIRDMVDADTMIGTPISGPPGVMVVPVSRMSFGFGTGAGSRKSRDNGLWGGNGAAVKVEPMAFLVFREGCVHLLNMAPPPVSAGERLLDRAPEILDKIQVFWEKSAEKKGQASPGE